MSWNRLRYHEIHDYRCPYLKNMLQWIRHLFPSIDQVLVTLLHDEIQILIYFSRHHWQTIMNVFWEVEALGFEVTPPGLEFAMQEPTRAQVATGTNSERNTSTCRQVHFNRRFPVIPKISRQCWL